MKNAKFTGGKLTPGTPPLSTPFAPFETALKVDPIGELLRSTGIPGSCRGSYENYWVSRFPFSLI